jgi:ABC-type Fe3+/spermidine/putrescine transport system ATPase subunit
VLHLENLHARFGDFSLSGISLDVADGEHFVLLGPSGAGKSLLLECILGLRSYKTGDVFVAGTRVKGSPITSVPVSFVPQDLALFPHLNVRENILFGARARRMPMEQMEEKLETLVRILDIQSIVGRSSPKTLSIGEQQRVALARALMIDPKVLFLDEPFSAVGRLIKRQLLDALLSIRRNLRVTVFQITHDQEEAFLVADRIGVIFEGRLVQTGNPLALLRNPASVEVASLLMARNIFHGTVESVHAARPLMTVRVEDRRIRSPRREGMEPGDRVALVVRPEDIRVFPGEGTPLEIESENLFRARIRRWVPQIGGMLVFARVDGLGEEVEIHLSRRAFHGLNPSRISEVRLEFPVRWMGCIAEGRSAGENPPPPSIAAQASLGGIEGRAQTVSIPPGPKRQQEDERLAPCFRE